VQILNCTLTTILLCCLLVFQAWYPNYALCAPSERLLMIHALQQTSGPERTAQAASYDSMLEYLTDHGYRVVDRQSAEQASIQIAATHEIDPVLNKAAAVGLTFFSEYSIYFHTRTIVKDPEKGVGALVRVSAKLVDNTSAQVVSAKGAEYSSTGHTREDAIEKAARGAGKKTLELLMPLFDQHLTQASQGGRTVTVVIEGGSTRKMQRFEASLEQNPAVAAIREVEAGGGKHTFEIISRIRRDQLDRELLKAAAEQGMHLLKVRSEGNRSTWKTR